MRILSIEKNKRGFGAARKSEGMPVASRGQWRGTSTVRSLRCAPSVCRKQIARTRHCPPCSHYVEGDLVVCRIFGRFRSCISILRVKRPKIKRAQPSLRAFGLLQINRPYPPLSAMFALCRGRFSCVQNLWALPKLYFNTASEAPKDKKSAAFAALFCSAANKSPVLTRRGHARAISPRCPLPHTVPFSPPA